MKKYSLWMNGQWQDSANTLPVHDPFSGEVIAHTTLATPEQVSTAIQQSEKAFQSFRNVSAYNRSRLLASMVEGITRRREEFENLLMLEAGKPITLARAEVNRAIVTFTMAAEECKRMGGEILPVDIDASGRSYSPAQCRWFPRGPVLAISPFNFPLNLVAHKVAPALAVGTSLLLKPAPQAPGCAYLLAEIFESAAKAISDDRERVPLSAFQVVSASNEVIAPAIADERLKVLSFTGSDRVGWQIQHQASKKKVLLELGGNAAVIIHSDANLHRAAQRCAFGAFAYAGQSCISVQRIYVHESILEKFLELMKRETLATPFGDPKDAKVLSGPVISNEAAERIMSWIEAAKSAGAQVLAGGTRNKNVIAPTLMTNVSNDQKINCEEVFGPVALVSAYKDFEEALEKVNSSRFGLQAGLFTDSSRLVQQAFDQLEVGGVLHNEVPTYRADHLPYGGVKDSGLGREGLRYAMEDYCERKTLISWRGP